MNWNLLYKKSLENLTPSEFLEILIENRGIKTKNEVEDFLRPKIEIVNFKNVGIDAKEVRKAISLIKKTIIEKKAIVIYGDYDVDGVTGTAILWETLYSFWKNVHPYIPHRTSEGYGLSIKGIENIISEISDVSLIITVDNGIVAYKAVEYAKSKGIKVVITDHHTKGKKDIYSSSLIHTTQLCGAGVSYLLSREILREFNTHQNDIHLELAAIATVADLVPLNKYNRAILKFGLDNLHKSKRVGLRALFDEARIDQREIGTYHLGYVISPRLNASGRISHALDSLRLICTGDKKRAMELAKTLGEVNRSRQDLTLKSTEDATSKIKNSKSEIQNLIFVESKSYEQGIIGLVASRLTEEFYRPSIVVSIGDEFSKGSARSISGVNIIEQIRSCSKFLTEVGGHPMAAGFSIKTKDLPAFKKAILKKAEELNPKLLEKQIKIDFELEFAHINIDLFEQIQKLAPFGMGNPIPVFMTKGVNVVHLNKVGKEGSHLQMLLEKDGYTIRAILFNHLKRQNISIGDILDIAYSIEVNEWKDKKRIELKIKDLSSSI